MGDPLGAVGSIVGIAAFGLKFATTLQTYIEAVSEARESLRDIAFDVSATASALEQLDEFIRPDQDGKAIANDSGVKQVERLASQCEQVYTAIIHLIAKVVGVPKDENGKVTLDALDLHSLNISSRIRTLIWPFQEPRIKRHQEDLRWLKISLLFHLRLMELARTKIMAPVKSPSAYEKEIVLQAALEKLLSQRKAYARMVASRRRRREKSKVRKRSLAGSSSSSIADEASSRSSSFKQGQRVPKASGSHRISSPSHVEKDSGMGIKNTASSSQIVPPTHAPKALTVEPKSSESVHTTQDAGAAPAESPDSSVNKDNKLNNNTEHTGPKERFEQDADHNMFNAASTASQAQINAQNLPPDAGAGQAVASSKPTNNGDEGGKSLHDGTIRHFNGRNTNSAKSPLGAHSALLWMSGIFRRRNKHIHSWESQELEAYLFESDSNTIRRLHFSRETLAGELRRATKSSGYDFWSQYASLSSAQRETVDRVTAEANHSSHHSRTCVAINHQFGSGQSCILVIFLLGPLVDPVYVKSGIHHFKFAFELCRTWEGIDGLIRQTLGELRGSVPVSYNLHGLDNQIIPRAMWSNTVCPGLVVFVQMLGPSPMTRIGDAGRVSAKLGPARLGPAMGINPFTLRHTPTMIMEKRGRKAGSSDRGNGVLKNARLISDSSSPESDAVSSTHVSYSKTAASEHGSKSQPDGKKGREEGDEEDTEADIINFEEEEMNAGLGLGVQLDMLTNTFSQAVESNTNDKVDS
ncbi:hypothetical protein F4811DRAFT_163065 [Daldinia bambusicola]|nr:hypothetical protein F4811DRAFT_163065 [Daldinia bambusicola]